MVDRLIKLFVMESKKNLRTVDLSNWVGKVYIGNRKHVDLIQEIPDLAKSTGLYFLAYSSHFLRINPIISKPNFSISSLSP